MNSNKKTETVRFFEAHCSDCNESFAVPLLSDFAYGEFILQTEDGKAFAYMNAIIEKSFELISGLVKEINQSENSKKLRVGNSYSSGDLKRLHWVIAQCADGIGGAKLGNQFRCPNCGSTDVSYGDTVAVRDYAIPVVSFERFRALSESEKKGRIRELYNIGKGLF